MREMKNSGIEWIGDIPSEWLIGRVKYVFYRKNEKAMQEDPVILSLARSGVRVRDMSNNDGQIAESYFNYNPVIPGDFLLNPMDLYSGANCNVSYVSGVISPAYINLRAKGNNSARYYDYFFKNQYWAMAMFAHGKGVSFDNRWTLSAETLLNYIIPIPSVIEQKKIADFLDEKCAEIDTVIEKTKATIEEYKKLKQSVITQAVTKGIRPNRPMKDSGFEWIGEIPADWIKSVVKRFCLLKTGSTPSTTNNEWFDGDLNWFTPGDFSEKYILCNSERKLSCKAKDDGVATIIPANTVMIVGIGGTAGKIGITTCECSCNQQITALISDYINARYLMYWMITNSKFLKETALYTTLPILNNQTIGEYLLIVPKDKAEQNEIVVYLDKKCSEIDDLIAKKTSLLSELESYKKSLIYEYVTGKKEV